MNQQSDIKDMLRELSQANLTQSQASFLKGLKRWYKWKGELSEKQFYCLASMYEQYYTRSEFEHHISNG